MKILIKNKFKLEDLNFVTDLIRGYYDPVTCNCIHIADMLSHKFINLTPVEVDSFIFDGAVHMGGHMVCKIEDTNMLLDAVGDCMDAQSLALLKNNMVPWIYSKPEGCSVYLSHNHFPFSLKYASNLLCSNPDEKDVLEANLYSPYANLRCISLKD